MSGRSPMFSYLLMVFIVYFVTQVEVLCFQLLIIFMVTIFVIFDLSILRASK